MILNRVISFILDYILIGFLLFYSLEPFYPAQERFISDNFFVTNISNIIFIIYILGTLIFFKQTLGMKVLKLKLKTEDCIFKVSIIKIILIPLYPLNLIFYPIRKKFIQDELSNSEIIKEN